MARKTLIEQIEELVELEKKAKRETSHFRKQNIGLKKIVEMLNEKVAVLNHKLIVENNLRAEVESHEKYYAEEKKALEATINQLIAQRDSYRDSYQSIAPRFDPFKDINPLSAMIDKKSAQLSRAKRRIDDLIEVIIILKNKIKNNEI